MRCGCYDFLLCLDSLNLSNILVLWHTSDRISYDFWMFLLTVGSTLKNIHSNKAAYLALILGKPEKNKIKYLLFLMF